jgi:hypothetical protein
MPSTSLCLLIALQGAAGWRAGAQLRRVPGACRAQPFASSTATATGLAAVLPMPDALNAAMLARGISTPTPIQSAAFGRVAAGESVVLHAETGSGKSLAFLLPTFLRLGDKGRAIVVAPTRELAVQLGAEAAGIAAALGGEVQLAIVGTAPTVEALCAARVIIGTPAELRFALCESDFAPQLREAFLLNLKVSAGGGSLAGPGDSELWRRPWRTLPAIRAGPLPFR